MEAQLTHIGLVLFVIMASASTLFGAATFVALTKQNTIALPFAAVAIFSGNIAYLFASRSSISVEIQEGLQVLASQMPF